MSSALDELFSDPQETTDPSQEQERPRGPFGGLFAELLDSSKGLVTSAIRSLVMTSRTNGTLAAPGTSTPATLNSADAFGLPVSKLSPL